MIIIGIVIGGGIFSFPPLCGRNDGFSRVDVRRVDTLGRVLALVGALCYAELATTFPNAGGDYHFLTRAYGRDVSFFFAWARVTVITTGAIALLAFVFGDYMSRVASLGENSSVIYAVLSSLSDRGQHRWPARIGGAQNVMSVLEVLGPAVCCGRRASSRRRPQAQRPRRRRGERLCLRSLVPHCYSCCLPMAAGTTPHTSRPRSRVAAARSSRF